MAAPPSAAGKPAAPATTAGAPAAKDAAAPTNAVDSASAEAKAAAGERFTAGMEAFEKGDTERAVALFRESYELVPSPNSRFMLGRSLAKRGESAEAYRELEAAAEAADALGERYAETGASARAKLEELRGRVALLTVVVSASPKGTRVLLGEEELPSARIGRSLAVTPGETRVTLVAPDGARRTESVTIAAGEAATLRLSAEDTETDAAEAPEPAYLERDGHLPHRLDLEVHALGETLLPPNEETRGAGAGARVGYHLLPEGLLPRVNDGLSVAVSGGYVLTSSDPHLLLAATAEWGFWFTPEFSLAAEAGVGVALLAGTGVRPTIRGVARYELWNRLHVVGRAGIPDATLGVAYLW
ncbi:MAG: hypothetical protein FJ104_15335 [Deltaproteobacteria bacterium]|nr:hypothetical protein [Deltaproteobacteria bacterium]